MENLKMKELCEEGTLNLMVEYFYNSRFDADKNALCDAYYLKKDLMYMNDPLSLILSKTTYISGLSELDLESKAKSTTGNLYINVIQKAIDRISLCANIDKINIIVLDGRYDSDIVEDLVDHSFILNGDKIGSTIYCKSTTEFIRVDASIDGSYDCNGVDYSITTSELLTSMISSIKYETKMFGDWRI